MRIPRWLANIAGWVTRSAERDGRVTIDAPRNTRRITINNEQAEVLNPGKYVAQGLKSWSEMCAGWRLATSSMQAKLIIVESGQEPGEKPRPFANHPWSFVLESPLPRMGWEELIFDLFMWKELTGNGFWHVIGDPRRPEALQSLKPISIAIVPSETERVEHYIRVMRGLRGNRKNQVIPTDEMVHFRQWNPSSDLWGMPLQAFL